MKVNELEGALLDYWAAKAEGLVGAHTADYGDGLQCFVDMRPTFGEHEPFLPSSDWRDGGPIIEQAGIELYRFGDGWKAVQFDANGPETWRTQFGPTPLIAAMRRFVASKFGDEVPAELVNNEKSYP